MRLGRCHPIAVNNSKFYHASVLSTHNNHPTIFKISTHCISNEHDENFNIPPQMRQKYTCTAKCVPHFRNIVLLQWVILKSFCRIETPNKMNEKISNRKPGNRLTPLESFHIVPSSWGHRFIFLKLKCQKVLCGSLSFRFGRLTGLLTLPGKYRSE